KFYSPVSGILTVDTCGTNDYPAVDQGIDTVISAHTSCPGQGGITLGCSDDDATGCDAGTVRDSRLTLTMTGGQTIYVRVTSYNPVTVNGWYEITAHFTPTQFPANDNCANATPIGAPADITGNLIGATPDGVSICDYVGGRDLWYRYHAGLAGSLRVTTC